MIVTAVWQRHELTDIVLSYYGKLAVRSKGKIQLLAVGSEGDKSRMMCERNGWKYIERSNTPVSHKWSSVIQEARNFDFDFLIAIGSDDLLSLSLIKFYDKVYSRDSNYLLGLRDLYLFMMSSGKSYQFNGYENLKTIGAGRCMSRNVLERVEWKPWSDYAINRGLDSRLSSHLLSCGIGEKWVKMSKAKGICVAIKHNRVAITEDTRIIAASTESENMLKKEFPVEYALINPKIKLAIVTGVWQRPDVFEYFAAGIHKLESSCTDLKIVTIIAGSEGMKSRQMVERHRFKYVEIANDPLAAKMNATILTAGKLKSDYVLCLGSDDIVTPELMSVYLEYIRQGIDYIAVLDWYFYDTATKQAAYWGGYIDARKGHTCGAGRLISARLMRLWRWQPWENRHSHILDNSMQEKLNKVVHTSAIFSLKEKGVFGLDIKSETNMTPFELWDNTKYIPVSELKSHFPYVIK